MRLLPFFTLLTAAGCAGLAGCSTPETPEVPKNLVTRNDFESIEGWMPIDASLTTEKAHSGRYSLRVGGNTEYSLAYKNLLSSVSPTRLQKIDVSAWAMMPAKGSTGKIIVEIKNPADGTQGIFWENIDLGEQVKELNKWTEVKKTFTLPANIEPTYELRVYLWRGASGVVTFLDDLVITRAE